jgi:hypothetical protein
MGINKIEIFFSLTGIKIKKMNYEDRIKLLKEEINKIERNKGDITKNHNDEFGLNKLKEDYHENVIQIDELTKVNALIKREYNSIDAKNKPKLNQKLEVCDIEQSKIRSEIYYIENAKHNYYICEHPFNDYVKEKFNHVKERNQYECNYICTICNKKSCDITEYSAK